MRDERSAAAVHLAGAIVLDLLRAGLLLGSLGWLLCRLAGA